MRDAMREARDWATLGGRRMALVIVALGLTLLPACSQNDATQVVNTGVDCGLVRRELTGTWQVSFTPNSVLTTNCDAGGFNGRSVFVNSTPQTYSSVFIGVSDTSAAFLVTGDGGSDPLVNPELIGSVQADSCLALLSIWDSFDQSYIQCIGIFDRPSGTIAGSCDSADIDDPLGGSSESTCDLNAPIFFTVGVL